MQKSEMISELFFPYFFKEKNPQFLNNHILINKGARCSSDIQKLLIPLRVEYLIHLYFDFTLNFQKTVETMKATSTLNSSGKTDEMIIYHQMEWLKI